MTDDLNVINEKQEELKNELSNVKTKIEEGIRVTDASIYHIKDSLTDKTPTDILKRASRRIEELLDMRTTMLTKLHEIKAMEETTSSMDISILESIVRQLDEVIDNK